MLCLDSGVLLHIQLPMYPVHSHTQMHVSQWLGPLLCVEPGFSRHQSYWVTFYTIYSSNSSDYTAVPCPKVPLMPGSLVSNSLIVSFRFFTSSSMQLLVCRSSTTDHPLFQLLQQGIPFLDCQDAARVFLLIEMVIDSLRIRLVSNLLQVPLA